MHTIDPKACIHHRPIVAAHAAGADRMVNGFSALANILFNIGIADNAGIGLIITTEGRQESLTVEHLSGQLDPFAQHRDVIRVREIIRINQGRGERILTGQKYATPTLRSQLTNVNGAAKARRQLATMITQKCRQKMKLHIRSRRVTEDADKSARFGSITSFSAGIFA